MRLASSGKATLGELLEKAKKEAKREPRKLQREKRAELSVKTVSLSPSSKGILEELMELASEKLERKISASAVVRALLKLNEQKQMSVEVLSLIETELCTGEVVWGKEKRS